MCIAQLEAIFAHFANSGKNFSGVINSRAREFVTEVIDLLVEVLDDWPLDPLLVGPHLHRITI
jgi:hypothetical protein